MNPVEMIRKELSNAHRWIEAIMAEVTAEAAHYDPGGTAHPIGSRYAHALVSEDMLVNVQLRQAAPIHAGFETGLQDPLSAFRVTEEWAKTARVDLVALRAYAQEVYAATDDYLAGLQPEDLDNEIDLSAFGYGTWTLGNFLMTFLFSHVHNIMGEIAAVKGMQGLKGMPF